jgi:hypothetical protein
MTINSSRNKNFDHFLDGRADVATTSKQHVTMLRQSCTFQAIEMFVDERGDRP